MNKKNVYAVKFQHKEHQNEKLEPWIIAPSVVDAILNANKWIGKKRKRIRNEKCCFRRHCRLPIRRTKMIIAGYEINIITWILGAGGTLLFLLGVNIVRPVEVRLVERLGRYIKTLEQGFHWTIPFIDSVISVNVTENMVDIEPQTVITKDKLNVVVDAAVYYKINDSYKASYNVDDHEYQLVSLSQTTLRAVIGQMTLAHANENRNDINTKLKETLDKETENYGVDVLRVEIQKIEPPDDVVASMNNVVKAEQEKIASYEKAKAVEATADGERMAAIKNAEGVKQASILEAEGKARAIELVNDAAAKHFKDGAVVLKQLEVVRDTLKNSTKLIVPQGSNLLNLIGDMIHVQTNPPS